MTLNLTTEINYKKWMLSILVMTFVVTFTIAVATVPFVGTLDVTIEANDR